MESVREMLCIIVQSGVATGLLLSYSMCAFTQNFSFFLTSEFDQ